VRRFQKIDVNEPTIEDTLKILKGLKVYYEEFHKLKYTNDALKVAVDLSAKYITDRKLPDKAIDVIDEAGAGQMLLPESKRKKTIGVKEIEAVVAKIARIPPKSVSKSDTEALKELENDLQRTVFGQPEAIVQLSSAMKMARAGLRDPQKPIGCYRSRSAAICSAAQPAWARPRRPASWPRRSASNCCGSTCPSTWSDTRSAA